MLSLVVWYLALGDEGGGRGPEEDRCMEGVFRGVSLFTFGNHTYRWVVRIWKPHYTMLGVVQALTNTGRDSPFWVAGLQMSKQQHTHRAINKQNMVNM